MLLAVGALFQVLDLSMAVLASLVVIFAVIELGGKYPYLIYAVTSVLSMLLVPVKTAPLAYVCFAGFYPIVKAALERRLHGGRCLLAKLAVFNVCFALIALALIKLFTALSPALWMLWLIPLANFVFLLYDLALTKLITAYLMRWRQRFTFLHK